MSIENIFALATVISILLSIVSILTRRHLNDILPKKVLDILPLGGHDLWQLAIVFFALFCYFEVIRLTTMT